MGTSQGEKYSPKMLGTLYRIHPLPGISQVTGGQWPTAFLLLVIMPTEESRSRNPYDSPLHCFVSLRKDSSRSGNPDPELLRHESRRGQPGLRGQSPSTAVQNREAIPAKGWGLSSTPRRDAETTTIPGCARSDLVPTPGANETVWPSETEKTQNGQCCNQ